MAFSDHELNAALDGKTVNGLGITQTAPLTLEMASGDVTIHSTGITYTLATPQVHVFTSDPTNPKQVFVGLVDVGGGTADMWVDSYVDDGLTEQANPPNPLLFAAAWFTIAAGETDLANATINRRVWM